jgi:hypothetical protein
VPLSLQHAFHNALTAVFAEEYMHMNSTAAQKTRPERESEAKARMCCELLESSANFTPLYNGATNFHTI